MFCRALAALIGLTSIACNTSRTQPEVRQFAVLRFENLSSDPSLDWMGRAFSEILSGQLSGSPARNAIRFQVLRATDKMMGMHPVRAPGKASELEAAMARRADRIVYGTYTVVNNRLEVDAWIGNGARSEILRSISVSGSLAEGPIPLADRLARAIGETVTPYSTHSQRALRAYVSAIEASDISTMRSGLAEAVEADPNFGEAYVAAVQLALNRRDTSEAATLLARARTRGTAILPVARARLAVEESVLRADPNIRRQALEELARLTPTDPDVFRTLAQVFLEDKQYRSAADAMWKAASLQPEDADLLNNLGYTEAYAGNRERALEALARYEKLRPKDPNPLDSQGDVNLYLGRPADAEKLYLAAAERSPGFLNDGDLRKAAMARLMTGDVAGATGLFDRYLTARRSAGDPAAALEKAVWLWQTGTLAEAKSLASEFASKAPGNLASRALAQLALWELQTGNREAARLEAGRALARAVPETAAAAIIEFASQSPADAAAWQERAGRRFTPQVSWAVKQYALACAFLFSGAFDRAAAPLAELFARTEPHSDPGLAVMLAWAHLKARRFEKAAALVRYTPLPQPSASGIFDSLYPSKLFYVRGAVLAHAGEKAEAQRNYRIFLALSGTGPDTWGEQAEARAYLTSSARHSTTSKVISSPWGTLPVNAERALRMESCTSRHEAVASAIAESRRRLRPKYSPSSFCASVTPSV